jgi:hypothetical protein
MTAIAVSLVALTFGIAAPAPPAALADGDPASDVLTTAPLFNPVDGASQAQQAGLLSLLAAAQRAGVPIRVALIGSPADLGSIGALWLRPALYASFLGVELSYVYHGTLLVVMPNGFGLAAVGEHGGRNAGSPASLASLRAPGSALGAGALDAVRAVAAAAGHPLTASPAPRSGSGSGSGSFLASVDAGSWLALLAGLLVIVAAWTASLRSRPARLPGRARRATG